MANARIVSLLREGQKLVFGDTEEVAWRLRKPACNPDTVVPHDSGTITASGDVNHA